MDISALRERRCDSSVSVSELNGILKNLIENDRTLKTVSVRGEISNFTNHRSGHLYFTLKDAESQIKAVMFRSSAQHLKFLPKNGMRVTVRASVGVYVQGGAYQLYVSSIMPDGIGALYLAYEQLKARLGDEGLFDACHKRDIPKYPERIGVITSPTGAAIRDIINVCGRRYPLSKIYLYPSLVQGDGAEANLLAALDYFDKSGLVDLIIIGRGGGSLEDLFAFNSESLARRIFDCKIPVISAVGHETDFTICDFVADRRAPTPSAAAELAVPDIREIAIRLDMLTEKIVGSTLYRLQRYSDRLSSLKNKILSARGVFDTFDMRLREVKRRIDTGVLSLLEEKRVKLALLGERIGAMSPLSVMSRGYSVLYNDGRAVRSVNDAREGDILDARLIDGTISVKVIKRGADNE